MRTLRNVIAGALGLALCASVLGEAPERSPQDLARDATSKPFMVMDFMGVRPGWKVIDVFAGGGYYSELLAGRVGETGKVYLHNNQAYMGIASNLDQRMANGRLPNVEPYIREIEDIDLRSDSLDMALLVMSYHDAYWKQNGWTVTPGPLFSTLHRILKPGGVLAIVDHHAEPGTGTGHVQDLHRIDAKFARADIESRGFLFVGASDVLLNPDDDLSVSVFDPAVRGKTSRFVYKFVKQ